MPTRREILIGALAAGAAMHMRTSYAKASQPGTPVNFDVPGRLLNQLPVWAPDAGIRKKILVDNPARLYAF